ncbi:LytR/AlgR family response regulator transcription factor [Carboxylicivirga linearis]|uniref:Response regulator transcription factor n=1 Tax=Carboxylicivirga linearis TaxID=1628157 RepID=A0ABS5JQ51_9BACT|nr:LytTR family DNA-binding domain-containing protein [Carboxylicivirga linearis]MBS2096947.1 response regulator transcription factor [Carboxylicivirga linearis]
MDTIKCLIVDDEDLAIDVLEEYVSRIDYLELAGSCRNAMEAMAFLNEHKVDLVFLDIQMPGLTGLQLLKNITDRPEVILTTAYSEYALEGFELQVLDYLIKPIPFDRFVKAINRFFQVRKSPITLSESSQSSTNNEAFIFVKSDKMMVKILLREITYVESLRNYVAINMNNGKIIKTMNTISNIEEKLPETNFLRVHRSFIIAIDKIDSFTSGSFKINSEIIPIGRQYKELVKNRLEQNSID